MCETIPELLINIDENNFNEKLMVEKWSKKEIIGYLIDSATNNHQRFVRCQFEDKPQIIYDQNNWNNYNFYHQIDSIQIIDFWTIYNKQLLELRRRIPNENLQRECFAEEKSLSLEFLIHDYVEYLDHHLKQVISI
ncbi:MAG: hypothetical protein QM727_12615 [Niabella sp.]